MSNFNSDEQFVDINFLKERYNKSRATINRWILSGKLPKPEYLNGRPVWRESTIATAEESLLSTTSKHNLQGNQS